jgi:hypothetical protein
MNRYFDYLMVSTNTQGHSPFNDHKKFCRVHGLQMPDEAFFHQNPKLFGLGRQIGQINFFFGQLIHTHFGTVSPLSMFSINHPLFLQKTRPLYPHPKYLFGIGI